MSIDIAGPSEEWESKRDKRFIEEELAAFTNQKDCSNITQHRITMKDDIPIKQKYYPKNPKIQGEMMKR